MKKLCVSILCLTSAVTAFAQTKTVTNADLEKFRQQRLKAERELKENYAKMGFPSPEEIEKRNARERAELEQYAERLRSERLQKEILAEVEQLRSQVDSVNAQVSDLLDQGGYYSNPGYVYSYDYPFYGYGYGYYGKHRFRGGRFPLAKISRLPQNMRTVQEHAIMYPSSQSVYQQATGNVRIGAPIGRFGGGRFGGGSRGR